MGHGGAADGGFSTAWKGYARDEVDAFVAETDVQLCELAADVADLQVRNDELVAELARYHGLEDELQGAIRLSREMNERVLEEADRAAATRVAAAEHEARAMLAEARERIARETAEMEQYRLAIAAEAATLAQIEQRLGNTISRAAAALVEIVDGPGGLGPFSLAAARLVEFARLLHQSNGSGALAEVRIDLVDGAASATLTTHVDGSDQATDLDQANAANSSSMALS